MTVDPAMCLHPRLRHMYGPVHECLECGLRGERVGWVEPPLMKVCLWCGGEFPRRYPHVRCCSISCGQNVRHHGARHPQQVG